MARQELAGSTRRYIAKHGRTIEVWNFEEPSPDTFEISDDSPYRVSAIVERDPVLVDWDRGGTQITAEFFVMPTEWTEPAFEDGSAEGATEVALPDEDYRVAVAQQQRNGMVQLQGEPLDTQPLYEQLG